MNAPAPALVFHVPDDLQFLAAWARVSIRHAHLEYSLRMMVRTLEGLSIQEALDATAHTGPGKLRKRILKLARRRLGDGAALIRLQAILERSRQASERRNVLLHN